MSKRMLNSVVASVLIGATIFSVALTGCGGKSETPKKVRVRIGTLRTEDSLPLFVALEKGFFKKKNLDVEIENFPSAESRDAALKAGKVDGIVGDVLAAGVLENRGLDISIISILLGATPEEGRYALLVPGKSRIKSVAQLRNVPIAVSKNTITEYVTEEMLKENGLKKSEIKTVDADPMRLEMIVAGLVEAGTLPDPSAVLATKKGARVLLDDTRGNNLSQSILIFRKDFLNKYPKIISSLLEVQDEAAKAINGDRASYQALLAQRIAIPPIIARTYRMGSYPKAQLAEEEDVERVLVWMKERNLIKDDITYERLVD